MKYKVFFTVLFALFFIIFCKGQSKGEIKREINPGEFLKWEKWGQGEVFEVGEQICLKESDETKGVMLISPSPYEGDVIVRFEVLALTSASVIAVVLAGSNIGESNSLSIPEDYDGNFSFWSEKKDNYFFAFKNAPHGLTPFVAKNPTPGEILASADKNVMMPGLFYNIEVGKVGNKLWFSIDEQKIFEVHDDQVLFGGHVALRVRGTAGFTGACLIKNLSIATEIP